MAPAAPSVWPISDLVALTAILSARDREELSDGLGFDGIADRRRRGMGIDVIHLRCRDAGIGQGEAHRGSDFFAVFARDDHMIGLAGRGVAGHFGIDARLAFLRMGGGFQDRGRRRLPPSRIRHANRSKGREASFGLIVVFGRERAQGTESGKDQRRNAGIGSDGDHHVGTALSDALQGLPEVRGRWKSRRSRWSSSVPWRRRPSRQCRRPNSA